MSKKKKVSRYVAGAGVAAAIAGGLIAFLTQTSHGKKLAKQAHKQMTSIIRELMHRADKVKDMSKAKYEEMVDEIVDEYQKKKKLSKTAAMDLAKELKKEWKEVQRELKK